MRNIALVVYLRAALAIYRACALDGYFTWYADNMLCFILVILDVCIEFIVRGSLIAYDEVAIVVVVVLHLCGHGSACGLVVAGLHHCGEGWEAHLVAHLAQVILVCGFLQLPSVGVIQCLGCHEVVHVVVTVVSVGLYAVAVERPTLFVVSHRFHRFLRNS